MLQLTHEYRIKVLIKLLDVRKNFDGTDAAFANQYSINNTVFSRLKRGAVDNVIKDSQWLSIGRQLNVQMQERQWNVARTEVFSMIEEEIIFCQDNSKAKILVDDCGIGKTFTAKYLSQTRHNCFYVDASQAKTKQSFIRLIAHSIGVEDKGRYAEVKTSLKYALHALPKPIIIIDEAGDLEYQAFLELKEMWNATENICGWYLMGADGLKNKINQGIEHKKVGYREMFSRFSEKYSSVVPAGKEDKVSFYKRLIGDVLSVNTDDKTLVNTIIKKCLVADGGNIGGLRRAESLLILNS
jgi:hypothetical protein